jgi:PBP1b-binding outer membrane lipoprotein LpoB
MKYIALIAALVLTGCATPIPVTVKFPDAPEVLKQQCPQLKTIPTETTVFSELTKTVTENYTTYYECAVKLDGWIEWYNVQKEIFDKAGK